MSPAKARPRTLYLLIFSNLALLCVNVGLALYVGAVDHRVSVAEDRSYAGCVRGNALREGYRFAMNKLGSPGRAAQPEVQPQDCGKLYPGGKP